ncbi:MAG TPA: hypothetical protein VNY33_10185, partial [Gaiellaceae bacterium]|nr:hypothetical protein [Gaiellaceae bacterium]
MRILLTPGAYVASSKPSGRIVGNKFQIAVGTLKPRRTTVVTVILGFPAATQGTNQLISGIVMSGSRMLG